MRNKIVGILTLGVTIVSLMGLEITASASTVSRRNNIKSEGSLNFNDGKVHIDSSDFMYLADEIDILESSYKITTVDALNSIGVYFKADGSVTRESSQNEVDTDEEKTALSFGKIKEGIAQSQSMELLSQIQAVDKDGNLLFYATEDAQTKKDLVNTTTTDTGFPVYYQAATARNLSAGAAAWVNGELIKGNGADNAAYREQGIAFADSRVNADSASYKDGYNKGIAYADGKVNTNSASYKDGYNKGITHADSQVNTNSASYKDGYNKGIAYADGKVNTNSASYKDGYNKGITYADSQVNTNSASYKDGYNKGIAYADSQVNTNSTNYKTGYNEGVSAADGRVNTSSASYTSGYDAGFNAGKTEYLTGTITGDGTTETFSVTFDKPFSKTPTIYVWGEGSNGGAAYTYLIKTPIVTTEGFTIESLKSGDSGLNDIPFLGTLRWIAIAL